MTRSQDIIDNTVPGRVYSPAEVAELIGYPRTANVKKIMDDLVEYRYFERWNRPKRYKGRETYAYLRIRSLAAELAPTNDLPIFL